MKTSPVPSTATPEGWLSPEATVVCVPDGVTSTTRLLKVSAMKTSPVPSTATPLGTLSPEPTVVCVPDGVTSTTRLLKVSAMKTSPEPSTATPKGSLSPVAGTTDCALVGSTPELLGAKLLSPL